MVLRGARFVLKSGKRKVMSIYDILTTEEAIGNIRRVTHALVITHWGTTSGAACGKKRGKANEAARLR